ncbi:MAG: nucleic acid-binding protein [Holophagaceae bacterium]|nr:nucleic acid-binding protein [Holophagaceae bacterium]
MEHLATLRDLQATLDYLSTIQRELSALPPDLAALDAKVKAAEKQIADRTKSLETTRAQLLVKSKELVLAQKDEDRARAAVKATSQKVHYTSAIRELDEKERLRASVAKPLKALEALAQSLEETLAALELERAAAQAQFDELHAIFLEEHANQVEGRKQLQTKQADLEARLQAHEVARFHRLANARQGKVVVPVENGACTGCRVKLRSPLLFQLREAKDLVICESCQRILFLP